VVRFIWFKRLVFLSTDFEGESWYEFETVVSPSLLMGVE
jgi:hypothetical protein